MITSKVAGIVLAISTVGPLVYHALDRSLPITFSNTVVLGSVEPGKTVAIEYEISGNENCPAEFERRFIDSAGVVTMIRNVNMNYIGPFNIGTQIVKLPVPLSAEEGPGEYWITASFKCNFVQRWIPVIQTFEIPITVRKGKS